MKIGCVIQARMNSERLPGKVLQPVEGKPLLAYLLDRLTLADRVSQLVVATSSEQTDDEVAEFCEDRGTPCFRGSLVNVGKRYLKMLDRYGFDAFVRVSGDGPWIDPLLVDEAVARFESGTYDIVSNVLERTFPKGQSVEVICTKAYRKFFPQFEGDDFEHVTPYFYRNRHKFQFYSMRLEGEDYSSARLCVDTEEDLENFKQSLGNLKGTPLDASWREVLETYQTMKLKKVKRS